MGKAKKARSKSSRTKPGMTAAVMSSTAHAPPGDQQSQGVLIGLEAEQPTVREATCIAVASMFGEQMDLQRKRLLQHLLQAGLVERLLQRLKDTPSIRVNAMGALRNVSIAGGFDICEEMVSKGLVSTTLEILQQTLATEDSCSVSASSLLEQSLAVLSHLSEASDRAVQQITQSVTGLQAVVSCLNTRIVPPAAQSVAGQLLNVASDNNPLLAKQLEVLVLPELSHQGPIRAMDLLSALLTKSINFPEATLFQRLQLSGILANLGLSLDKDKRLTDECLSRVLPTVLEGLEVDASGVREMALRVSEEKKEMKGLADVVKTDVTYEDNDQAQKEVDDLKARALKAQQVQDRWSQSVNVLKLALEVLTNICAAAEAEEELVDWETDEEDEMAEASDVGIGTDSVASDSQFSQALERSGILNQLGVILDALYYSYEAGMDMDLLEDLKLLQARCCQCLTNLVQHVPASAVQNALPALFASLLSKLKVSIEQQNSAEKSLNTNVNVPEALTAAIWAILRRSLVEGMPVPLEKEELTVLTSLLSAHSPSTSHLNPEVRVHLAGCLGTLGQFPHNEETNKALLKALDDPALLVLSEVLNAIFDVYAGENHDDTFRTLSFPSKLEEVAADLKTKLRRDARTADREVLAQAKEARLNLVRFIKYKAQTMGR